MAKSQTNSGKEAGCSLSASGFLILSVLFFLLSGCAVGPDYQEPELKMPDQWHMQLTKGLSQGQANLQTWWTVLGDPRLEDLIKRASAGSLTLQEAVGRIKEAHAVLGIATGERYPDVDGFGDANYGRISEGIRSELGPDQSRNDWFFALGSDLVWEIDLWGRVTRSIESARGNYQASLEDYRDVLVLLYAEVAQTYVQVRTLQERIKYAEANVALQKDTLKLTKARVEAQIAPELDVRQAEYNLANTESVIPSLKQELAQAVNRLGVLIGEYPSVLYQELTSPAEIPHPPKEVLVSIPADVLRQRPDIRRTERALAAQTARIGLQTAELYPTFSIFGAFSFEAFDSVGDLFDAGSKAYSIGPRFRWNLFDGGRVRNAIKVEEARTEQLLARYEQTVLEAVEEVESAMVAYVQEKDRRDALRRAATASARSVELVKTLYITGLTDFQNVLDNERSLALQEDELAASEGLVTQNLVRIYRALGGGWTPEDEPAKEVEASDNSQTNEQTS